MIQDVSILRLVASSPGDAEKYASLYHYLSSNRDKVGIVTGDFQPNVTDSVYLVPLDIDIKEVGLSAKSFKYTGIELIANPLLVTLLVHMYI